MNPLTKNLALSPLPIFLVHSSWSPHSKPPSILPGSTFPGSQSLSSVPPPPSGLLPSFPSSQLWGSWTIPYTNLHLSAASDPLSKTSPWSKPALHPQCWLPVATGLSKSGEPARLSWVALQLHSWPGASEGFSMPVAIFPRFPVHSLSLLSQPEPRASQTIFRVGQMFLLPIP